MNSSLIGEDVALKNIRLYGNWETNRRNRHPRTQHCALRRDGCSNGAHSHVAVEWARSRPVGNRENWKVRRNGRHRGRYFDAKPLQEIIVEDYRVCEKKRARPPRRSTYMIDAASPFERSLCSGFLAWFMIGRTSWRTWPSSLLPRWARGPVSKFSKDIYFRSP